MNCMLLQEKLIRDGKLPSLDEPSTISLWVRSASQWYGDDIWRRLMDYNTSRSRDAWWMKSSFLPALDHEYYILSNPSRSGEQRESHRNC